MKELLIPESEFALYIKSHGIGDKANLKAIDGKFRWVITLPDGTEYIARPNTNE